MLEKIKIADKEKEVVIFHSWINEESNQKVFDISLDEEGCSLVLAGIFLGTGMNKAVFNSCVSHRARRTKSRTEIRGVFFDSSEIDNEGIIRIQKNASGADGYFSSKILLFSDAKGRSVPSLEIDENDLKAGHASTIGRPDLQQLFYLKSRGINEAEAIKLVVMGFYEPVLCLLSKKEQRLIKLKILKGLKEYAKL